jgi:hypothetical protein
MGARTTFFTEVAAVNTARGTKCYLLSNPDDPSKALSKRESKDDARQRKAVGTSWRGMVSATKPVSSLSRTARRKAIAADPLQISEEHLALMRSDVKGQLNAVGVDATDAHLDILERVKNILLHTLAFPYPENGDWNALARHAKFLRAPLMTTEGALWQGYHLDGLIYGDSRCLPRWKGFSAVWTLGS